VPIARLDAVIDQDVAFVKIDVEGHELNVLNGAIELLERCQPVFLVEAAGRRPHERAVLRQQFLFLSPPSRRRIDPEQLAWTRHHPPGTGVEAPAVVIACRYA
jgi:hypothetical protein